MKKIIKYTLLSLLAFLPAVAQNTASVSGNWDDCATWGNPSSILQNATDTKTINAGITVIQNTTWSTQNVTFNGTGAVSFASSANSIDFVIDGGGDKSCVVANCTTPTLSAISGTTSITAGGNATYTVTGSNYTSIAWTVKNSGGTVVFSGTGLTTNSLTFSTAGTYTVTFTATNATAGCTATVSTVTSNVTVNPATPGLCGGNLQSYFTTHPAMSRAGVGLYFSSLGNPSNDVYIFGTNVGYTRIVYNGVTYNLNLNPTLKYGKLGDPGVTGNGYVMTISAGGVAAATFNVGCGGQYSQNYTLAPIQD